MANNSSTTPIVENQKNQVEGGQHINPETSRREFIKRSLFTAIVAGTSLKLENALAFLGPNEAYAGGNTPEELAKLEKATIEANGGIINVNEFRLHLAKLEVKNPDEVLKLYEGLSDVDKSFVGNYLNIGLKSPNNARLKNGVINLVEGLNNKKIYVAFLQHPTKDNVPEGTTLSNFVNASKAFTGAELIVTKEIKEEIKGIDNEVDRVRIGIANNRIEVAKQESAVAKQNQTLIKEVSDGVNEINELSGNIKKGASI